MPTGSYVGPSDAEIRAQLIDALGKWSTFPVDNDPRPIVLLSDAFYLAGFIDVDTKKRFRRAVEVDPSLPPPVLDALRLASTYGHGTPSPVRVVGARASDRDFATDRGVLRLPVWELEMTNTIGPGHVMSAEWQAKAWPPQIAASRTGIQHGEASISANGLTVVFTFAGSPAVYASYPRTLVEESNHAVAIYPISQDLPDVEPGPRLQYLQHRNVEVTLARPLGGRVLLGFGRGPGPGPVSVTEPESTP